MPLIGPNSTACGILGCALYALEHFDTPLWLGAPMAFVFVYVLAVYLNRWLKYGR